MPPRSGATAPVVLWSYAPPSGYPPPVAYQPPAPVGYAPATGPLMSRPQQGLASLPPKGKWGALLMLLGTMGLVGAMVADADWGWYVCPSLLLLVSLVLLAMGYGEQQAMQRMRGGAPGPGPWSPAAPGAPPFAASYPQPSAMGVVAAPPGSPAPVAAFCRACGRPLTPGLANCAACGAPVW